MTKVETCITMYVVPWPFRFFASPHPFLNEPFLVVSLAVCVKTEPDKQTEQKKGSVHREVIRKGGEDYRPTHLRGLSQ